MVGWQIPPPKRPSKSKADFARERREKVVSLVKQGLLKSERIKQALLKVPREDFIPEPYRDYAYLEVPLPLPGLAATISCPHSYPLFYEPLGLDQGHRFLEVGLGSGYGAAVAREVVGEEGQVVSMEIDPATVNYAKANLERAGYRDVVLVLGDGGLGYPELQPYDRIAMTAACTEIPQPLLEQLAVGGRLIAPVIGATGQDLTVYEKSATGVSQKVICTVLYVNLRGQYGVPGGAGIMSQRREKRSAPMACQRDSRTQGHDETPAGALGDRLRLMFEWYKGMIDENTGRLLYLYDPENDVTIGDGEPIRDIASIWDVEVLSAFLGRNDLHALIRRSLDHFSRLIVERGGYAIVAPRAKHASIAHSAFLALALSRSEFPDKIQRLVPLIGGILHQQRKDGSYKIFFDAEPDSGEELYPAEAMLSLLEAYRLTRDAEYLDSVERGFAYYKHAYYDWGGVEPDYLVFFANWQSQVGRLLFEATTKLKMKEFVRVFLFELHDRVIDSGFYDRVARQPEEQVCVEVACGLEGLADAYAIAASTHDRRTEDYRRCILVALGFFLRAQRMTGCTDRERGGFGGSLAIREQRIDVTRHVASGFIKSIDNGIEATAT